jgi:hypothetical protein
MCLRVCSTPSNKTLDLDLQAQQSRLCKVSLRLRQALPNRTRLRVPRSQRKSVQSIAKAPLVSSSHAIRTLLRACLLRVVGSPLTPVGSNKCPRSLSTSCIQSFRMFCWAAVAWDSCPCAPLDLVERILCLSNRSYFVRSCHYAGIISVTLTLGHFSCLGCAGNSC